MADDNDDLDLNTLNDEDLVLQVHDDLYNGMKPEIEEATRILLGRGWSPDRVLNDALVEGMRIVGIDFRDGILFVPEVLLAANAMKGGMAILRPLLAETGVEPIGKMVIGTVKGDIHDIGKNLVAMMMEGAGFEVIDLGINNPVEKYLEALEQHKPDILGLSALLTTTMPYMKVVVDTLKEKGIRDDYIVLVGRRAAQRDLRQGRRRRRLLPRRRGRRRDREVADRRASRGARGAGRGRGRRGRRMTDTVLSSATREVVIGFERPFVIIGERINPTGRKILAAEMAAGDMSRVEADALAQVEAGAHMLDVNAGIPLADEPAILAQAIQLVQSITDVPLSIDSSIVAALAAGLAVYKGKALVNSVTGEEDRLESVLPLVKKIRRGGGGHLQRRDRHLAGSGRALRRREEDRRARGRPRHTGLRHRRRSAGHAHRRHQPDRRAGDAAGASPAHRTEGQHHLRRVERELRPAAEATASTPLSSRWRSAPGSPRPSPIRCTRRSSARAWRPT